MTHLLMIPWGDLGDLALLMLIDSPLTILLVSSLLVHMLYSKSIRVNLPVTVSTSIITDGIRDPELNLHFRMVGRSCQAPNFHLNIPKFLHVTFERSHQNKKLK